MATHTLQELQQFQALPLNKKVEMTKERIKAWVEHYGVDGVYISFSGGKDSTVLLHIARQIYPQIKAVFIDVPTQYPELRTFAKEFENVDIIKPKIGFMEVCEKYGFPFISKEVSECVQGARKYLNSIVEEQSEKVVIKKRSEQKCIYCDNLLGKKGCLGMCNKHYIQYKRWGDPLHADKKERATVDGYYRDGKTGRREHRVIWENYYGEELTSDEIIHHINFVKTDNRIENLYKYPNASEHIKAHREFERLQESLSDNETIVFENGHYIKREREREIHSDRQHKYYYFYEKVTGTGKYSKFSAIPSIDEIALKQGSRGGRDNKYRKLRGIGEFAKRANEKQAGRQQSEVGDYVRNADKREEQSDKGEYP